MALGIMLVLTISLTSVLFLTNAGAGDAQQTNARQKAYALAEAGLNNALSQIASHYPNTSSPAGVSSWATEDSAHAPTYPGGTASWTGSFDASANTWTLTGTGTVANPASGGSSIVKTAGAVVPITSKPPTFYGYGFFMGDPTAPCTTIKAGASVSESVYVASCLTLTGSGSIVEPSSPGGTLSLYVGNVLTSASSSTTVGQKSPLIPIASADILPSNAAGCKFSGSFVPCNNSAQSYVFANSYSSVSDVVALPSMSAATAYGLANWSSTGTNHVTCTTGSDPFDTNTTRDNNTPLVLRGHASFNCSAFNAATGAFVGSLAWNLLTGTTGTLTISGTVFVDGNFTDGSADYSLYSGSGTLEFNGTVAFSNDGSICGPASGRVAVPTRCQAGDSKVWDPTLGSMNIIACNSSGASPAFTMAGNAWFDGTIFANGFYQGGNSATSGGPVIAKQGDLSGSVGVQQLFQAPPGTPGSQNVLGTPSFS